MKPSLTSYICQLVGRKKFRQDFLTELKKQMLMHLLSVQNW